MTGALAITQADRARWQRQAAAELCRILDDCAGLPPIAWTVGPAGSVLAGRVSGLAPQVREAFSAWRQALALEEHREHQLDSGIAWLHAAARRSQVKVRLTATVCWDEDEGR